MTAIRWTEQAVEDLAGIQAYVARDSPVLARLVATRLYAAVSLLAEFPEAGRVVPERADPALRELVRPPYRLVYVLSADAVSILTIFHAARTFPESFEPPPR